MVGSEGREQSVLEGEPIGQDSRICYHDGLLQPQRIDDEEIVIITTLWLNYIMSITFLTSSSFDQEEALLSFASNPEAL